MRHRTKTSSITSTFSKRSISGSMHRSAATSSRMTKSSDGSPWTLDRDEAARGKRSEPHDPLQRPEHARRGDEHRGRDDEARAVPRSLPEPRRQDKEGRRDDGELRELDADVEADQGRAEL